MKILSALVKIVIGVVLVGIVFIIVVFGIFVNEFKGYKERSVGYDNNPVLKNPAYEKYQTFMTEANRKYYTSNAVYYFIARDVKGHIVKRCIDRDLKENNVTETSGWRFVINMEEDFIRENKIDEDMVNEKFSKSMDKSEALGLNRFVLQHSYKYDKHIDCNRTMNEIFETYVKNYRKSHYAHELDQNGMDWISYLFFNYR